MSIISFRNATNRNTKCYEVNINGVMMLISYETVVAAQYRNVRIRRTDDWGPTTRRHMRETNVDNFNQLDEAEFNDSLDTLVLQSIKDSVERRLS